MVSSSKALPTWLFSIRDIRRLCATQTIWRFFRLRTEGTRFAQAIVIFTIQQ